MGFGGEAAAFDVERTDEVLAWPVGRDDQNPLVAELEEIGAFDVDDFAVSVFEHLAEELPLREFSVFGAVEQDEAGAAGLAVVGIAAADHVGVAVFGEEEWVAPVVDFQRAVDGGGEDGVARGFRPGDEIVIGGGASHCSGARLLPMLV